MKYILNGKRAVLCNDTRKWAKWFEDGNRAVGDDTVGNARVSTVFLALDHGYDGGIPILFETMIFGGPHDQYQDRYATWDLAEAGHRRVVSALQAGEGP